MEMSRLPIEQKELWRPHGIERTSHLQSLVLQVGIPKPAGGGPFLRFRQVN
jgi:hypothetical protein